MLTQPQLTLLTGHVIDQLATLPDASVHCVVTSPPYLGLRDYGTPPQVWGGDPRCTHVWGVDPPLAAKTNPGAAADSCRHCGAWYGQLGLEPSVELYVQHMVWVFRAVRRVLRPDGVVWLNLGDTYARNPAKGQHKPGDAGKQAYVYDGGGGRASGGVLDVPEKNLLLVPARVALALQHDGWVVRSDIVWSKPNSLPESVEDRPSRAHESVFLLSPSPRYWFDKTAITEPSVTPGEPPRNRRDVWVVPSEDLLRLREDLSPAERARVLQALAEYQAQKALSEEGTR